MVTVGKYSIELAIGKNIKHHTNRSVDNIAVRYAIDVSSTPSTSSDIRRPMDVLEVFLSRRAIQIRSRKRVP